MNVETPFLEKKIDKQTQQLTQRKLRTVKVPVAMVTEVKKFVNSQLRVADAAVAIGISYSVLRKILDKGTMGGEQWGALEAWFQTRNKAT